MGLRGDYIKVIPSTRNDSKYIPSNEFNVNTKVDTKYYIDNIITILKSITKALGMVSCDPIITGYYSVKT